VQPENLI